MGTYVMSFGYKERFALKSLQDAHAFELVFTWRNGEGFFGTLRFDRKLYEKMANIMSCTWSSFVVCQKPKCDVPVPGCADALQSIVDWPAFNGNTRSRQYLSMKETPTVEIVPRTANKMACVQMTAMVAAVALGTRHPSVHQELNVVVWKMACALLQAMTNQCVAVGKHTPPLSVSV